LKGLSLRVRVAHALSPFALRRAKVVAARSRMPRPSLRSAFLLARTGSFRELCQREVRRTRHKRTSGAVELHPSVTILGQQGTEVQDGSSSILGGISRLTPVWPSTRWQFLNFVRKFVQGLGQGLVIALIAGLIVGLFTGLGLAAVTRSGSLVEFLLVGSIGGWSWGWSWGWVLGWSWGWVLGC